MSNKEINNIIENQKDINKDFASKSNLHLFSFSQLKSKKNFSLSQYNNFKFNFSKKNNNEKDEKELSNNVRNRKIHLTEGGNTSSLNTLNINVASTEKLNEKDFQEQFMNEFEDSFAYFCGINKIQFKNIYINNKYIPKLNEFGDINISINAIIEILKSYSSSLKLKITRKILKKDKLNKIFKTFKNKNGKSIKKYGLNKKKNNENEENKNGIIKIDENDDYLVKGNQVNDIQENNILDNFKKKLKKIIINKDTNDRKFNNNFCNNEKGVFIMPIIKQNNLYNPKNDIFNFSPNIIQNSQNKNINDLLNNKRASNQRSNNIYNINSHNINNYNINNQMIVPQILNTNKDIISANSYSNSNIASPNIFTFSPFSPFYYNNYNSFDRFALKNNSNSFNPFNFYNSPFIPHNNINPNNNI